MRAEPTLATAVTATGPTSPEAHGLDDAAGQGATDGDRAGEPRSDAVADIAALLTPSQGEEPRSETRPDWLGEPDILRAPGRESDLPSVAEATSRRDPRLAPDPGLDLFVADLLERTCLPGDLPPHPNNDLVTCSMAPAVTPVDNAYLSPACVVCVMLGVGFRVVPIRPLPPRPEGAGPDVRVRSPQPGTVSAGHSRHFWSSEL